MPPTRPTYLSRLRRSSAWETADRSSGWLGGQFRDVLRRASSYPGSLERGLASTLPRQSLSCCAVVGGSIAKPLCGGNRTTREGVPLSCREGKGPRASARGPPLVLGNETLRRPSLELVDAVAARRVVLVAVHPYVPDVRCSERDRPRTRRSVRSGRVDR